MVALSPDLAARIAGLYSLPHAPATLTEMAVELRTCRGSCSPEQLLSDRPTRHRVRWGPLSGWTHCILDAMMLPFFNGTPAHVSSRSPVTGATMDLETTVQGVQGAPPGAVISLGLPAESGAEGQRACCPYTLLFSHNDAFKRWQSQNPGVVSQGLAPGEAWQLAALLMGARL